MDIISDLSYHSAPRSLLVFLGTCTVPARGYVMGIRLRLTIVIFTLAPALWLHGTPQSGTDKSRLDSAVTDLKRQFPGAQIEMSQKTGLPRRITGLKTEQMAGLTQPATLQDAEAIVTKFFNSNRGLFLQPGPQPDIQIVQNKLDPQLSGKAIVRVQQVSHGIEVFGAQASVAINLSAGAVEQLTTTFVVPPSITLTPSFSQENAQSVAKVDYQTELQTNKDLQESEDAIMKANDGGGKVASRLIIFDPVLLGLPSTGQQLAWLVSVGTFEYFVDAQTGRILHRFRRFNTAKMLETYDSNLTFILPGTLVISSSAPVGSANVCADAKAAHDYAGITYDYFSNVFARNSYDNSSEGGSTLRSSVRYGQLKNAYWDLGRNQMVYGPGYAAALNIVAHEITHGVIAYEAKLLYDGESGAANEAIADFFGAMVASTSGSEDWRLGENIPGYSIRHPMRDMADPHNGGFNPQQQFTFDSYANRGQPDYIKERVSPTDPICASTTDKYNGCVHFNSGILDKAFYLAAKGLAPGVKFHGVSVTGIGSEKLQYIVYRTLTTKLTSSSQFSDIANTSVDACNELALQAFKQILSADCTQVQNAFRAVGILE